MGWGDKGIAILLYLPVSLSPFPFNASVVVFLYAKKCYLNFTGKWTIPPWVGPDSGLISVLSVSK